MSNTKERTPLQKVCLQFGMDCYAASSSYGLIKLLKSQGQTDLATNVEIALRRAKEKAKLNYFQQRKELQPDWKDWDDQREELLKQLPN